MFCSRIECAYCAGTAGIVWQRFFAKQAMELMKSWGAGDNVWVYYEAAGNYWGHSKII